MSVIFKSLQKSWKKPLTWISFSNFRSFYLEGMAKLCFTNLLHTVGVLLPSKLGFPYSEFFSRQKVYYFYNYCYQRGDKTWLTVFGPLHDNNFNCSYSFLPPLRKPSITHAFKQTICFNFWRDIRPPTFQLCFVQLNLSVTANGNFWSSIQIWTSHISGMRYCHYIMRTRSTSVLSCLLLLRKMLFKTRLQLSQIL